MRKKYNLFLCIIYSVFLLICISCHKKTNCTVKYMELVQPFKLSVLVINFFLPAKYIVIESNANKHDIQKIGENFFNMYKKKKKMQVFIFQYDPELFYRKRNRVFARDYNKSAKTALVCLIHIDKELNVYKKIIFYKNIARLKKKFARKKK